VTSSHRCLPIKNERISWYVLAFVVLAAAHYDASAEPAAAAEDKPQVIELSRAGLTGDSTLTVEADPVYGTPKRFRGVSLMSFLQGRGVSRDSSSSDVVVEFLCEDGYNPIVPLSTLARDEAFLASSDADAAAGRQWVPFSYGIGQREPGPFYLVWPNSPADAAHPWLAKPESFRRNGKMPAFDHLGEEAITEILKYIQHMSRYKVAPIP
jgi:hypothetical protein